MALVTLTQEHLDEINNALDVAVALKEEIARAKVAGIELSMSLDHVDAQVDKLRAIKRAYWPNGANGAR